MKRIPTFAFAVCLALSASAANVGVGLDAFNRAISAAVRGNAVFSPISFEFDCVIFSEAFDALTRAKIAETIGVLNGLEGVYAPIAEGLGQLNDDHVLFRRASAFCLPDERKATAAYRKWLQQSFASEAFSMDFRKGAECWFRTRLDGAMEDFAIPDDALSARHYSFFDLIVFRCRVDAVPCATALVAKEKFYPEGEQQASSLDFVTQRKTVDIWKRKNNTVVRMPISNDLSFFAIMPDEKHSIRSMRNLLTSSTIVDIMSGIKSVTEEGITHGRTDVHVPVMDVTTESDLRLPFNYFRIPLSGMERMDASLNPRKVSQLVRFQLLPSEVASIPDDGATDTELPGSTFSLDRPFLFFVYHEKTQTIPVAGQFTGK